MSIYADAGRPPGMKNSIWKARDPEWRMASDRWVPILRIRGSEVSFWSKIMFICS